MPPIPNSPSKAVLLIAHSNLYKPKFLNISITGDHNKVIREENFLPFIWLIDSIVFKLIFSICSLKTFAFIAV